MDATVVPYALYCERKAMLMQKRASALLQTPFSKAWVPIVTTDGNEYTPSCFRPLCTLVLLQMTPLHNIQGYVRIVLVFKIDPFYIY